MVQHRGARMDHSDSRRGGNASSSNVGEKTPDATAVPAAVEAVAIDIMAPDTGASSRDGNPEAVRP